VGGRGISEERITDLLWPDAEGDMAHQSFDITLHRLRKLLGNAGAVSLHDGKLALDNRYCWVDVWAFEHLLGQAEELRKRDETDRARELVVKALAMYRGKFLAGEREELWMIPTSEYLRNNFIRGTRWLCNYCETAGNWDAAAGYYERFIDLDGSVEEMYRRLMVCYRNLGRHSEALSVYKRCRKVLLSLLGTSPSRETEAIRASILSQNIS
jgi:DNA-binding SARP family transcriptional activator